MGLGLKLLIGGVVVGTATAVAVVVLSDGSTIAGVTWSGTYDANVPGQARKFDVYRHGDGWAWKIDGSGSGTESDPIAAMKTVLGHLGDNSISPFGRVEIVARRGDDVLLEGVVEQGIGGGLDPYFWKVESGGFEGRRLEEGFASTRGAALLKVLGWIEEHGGGVEVEIGPDDDTVPIPPEELPQPPKPPTPPKVPDPPKTDEDEPSTVWTPTNLVELKNAQDFEQWNVRAAIDPDGADVEKKRIVLIGYARDWRGRQAALTDLWQLASDNPTVTFVHFDFALSREVFGQPEANLGYVATAIGPQGNARASVMLGATPNAMRMQSQRWGELVRFAKQGPGPDDALLFDRRAPNGRTYIVLVRRNGGAWEWLVWHGDPGDDATAVQRGGAPNRTVGANSARAWVDAQAGASPQLSA